jgi:peptide/nickel transport system ATP-binding protein
MYLGEFVELGDTADVVDDPKHPYTRALVKSVPTPDPTTTRESADIRGETPSARNPPSGCRFHTRCPEIIPPDDYEFEQQRYRELMDLRVDIDSGSLRPEFVRRRSEEAENDDPVEHLKSERFGGGFQDAEAEEIVDEALESFVDGDIERASERLRSAFTSPCERRTPKLQHAGDDDRLVACHLYDD